MTKIFAFGLMLVTTIYMVSCTYSVNVVGSYGSSDDMIDGVQTNDPKLSLEPLGM